MNETITRFGYPATLIADYAHWTVLLRPQQPTLGSLVLAARSDELAFGDLPAGAFVELGYVTSVIERSLQRAVAYARLNYLMLMMVDPHVHFHVIPRYEGTRTAQGVTVEDRGWPKIPALAEAVTLDDAQIAALAEWLKRGWR